MNPCIRSRHGARWCILMPRNENQSERNWDMDAKTFGLIKDDIDFCNDGVRIEFVNDSTYDYLEYDYGCEINDVETVAEELFGDTDDETVGKAAAIVDAYNGDDYASLVALCKDTGIRIYISNVNFWLA